MIDLEKRKILVFDLEVCANDFETYYDDETKEYLTKFATTEQEKLNAIDALTFSPFTSQIVCIGLYDLSREKKCCLINAGEGYEKEPEDDREEYVFGTEKEVMEIFWNIISTYKYDIYVTFNGREFDCPFVMLRSMVLGVRPSYNLMRGSDFTFKDYHVDLLKELTFHKHSPQGARRKFTLDFYCKMLGIQSSKCEGVTGEDVGRLFKEKQYRTIADYCIRDVVTEAELFKKWNELLNFSTT